MTLQELSQLMRDNGLVGCGGAGFPSYGKLAEGIDTLLINCAECEPLLRLHRQLVERKTFAVLQAATVIGQTLGVKSIKICLKKTYTKAIASLNQYLPDFPLVSLALLQAVYPAGDEVVMIQEATGRTVQPGKLPASVGVVVYNCETVYNLFRAMNDKHTTHKYVTIAGEVKNPSTFYAPIGSRLFGLIKRSGGATIEDPEILIGGPMMGFLGNENDVVTKTTNAVILLPKNHPVVLRKKTRIEIDVKRAMAACCQCHYCTDMCPRHLLGHPIDPSKVMRSISNQDAHNVQPYLDAFFCSGCGVCESYACHQGLSPRNVIGQIKAGLRAAGVRPPVVNEVAVPNKNRDGRKVPIERLRGRLDLEKYNHPAPIYLEPINAKEVKIMLSQGIGVPPVAIVKRGDLVKEGDLIAKAVEGKLSVNLHASIDGRVDEVTERYIIIRKV